MMVYKVYQSGLAATLAVLLSLGASANPVNPTVVHGNASFGQNGAKFNIHNTPGTIIDWQSFSIAQGELTRFIQQNGQSAVLNRVTGQLPSHILGQLGSNGKVFLINPNGLLIGNGAVIDTAGFLASTLDITNEDFLAGRLHFKGDGGRIENQGFIHAGKGGEVVLIAPQIENNGIIQTEAGEILLAAGHEVRLTSLDDANIAFKVQAPGDSVINLGKLIAENGAIRVFADSIFSSGELSASRVSQQADGTIRLEAESDITLSGSLDAQGQGVEGGDILVLGRDVSLKGAELNVSGQGGGSIRVGGDYQGKGTLKTARNTSVDAATTLSADASGAGDGGEVIIWSDGHTSSQGRITARGGELGGDGGFVETSGKKTLDFGQAVDVSALRGAPGTWLLDPEDITIGGSEAASISESLNGGSNVSIKTSDTGTGEGNITVASEISKTQGPDASLSLEAHNDIDVNAPITSSEGKLDVNLRAGSSISVNASVQTNGGAFSSHITGIVVEPVIELATEQSASEAEEPQIELEDVAPGVENTEIVANPDAEVIINDEPAQTIPEVLPPANEEDAVVIVPTQDSAAINSLLDDQRQQLVIQSDIVTSGGGIQLDSGSTGDVIISAVVDSHSNVSQGGDITIEGERIALLNGAIVDASGENGGEILIGGGQQGRDSGVHNAQFVHVAEKAEVHSDGGQTGDGGRVIVFAENTAIANGQLTARGGTQGGDGGFVETSGLRSMHVENAPNVSAVAGKNGTWLIDPYDIEVVQDKDAPAKVINNGTAGNQIWQPTGAPAKLWVGTVRLGLNGGDVIITTTHDTSGQMDPDPFELGDINWNADMDLNDLPIDVGDEFPPNLAATGSLSLLAHNNVNIRGSIYDSAMYSSPPTGGNPPINDNRLQNLTIVADQDGDGTGSVSIVGDSETVSGYDWLEIDAINFLSIKGEGLSIEGGQTALSRPVWVGAGEISIDAGSGDISIKAGADNKRVRLETESFNVGAMAYDINTSSLGAIDTAQAGAVKMLLRGSDDNNETFSGAHVGIQADQLDVNISGNLNLEGGMGAYSEAYIGMDWYASEPPTHSYTVGGNVNILGGEGAGSSAQLGIFYPEGEVVIHTLEMDVAGDLNVIGGTGNQSRAEIVSSENQTIEVGQDIHLVGGSGASADAQILVEGYGAEFTAANTLSQVANQNITAHRDIWLDAGATGARIRLQTSAQTQGYVDTGEGYVLMPGDLTVDVMQSVVADRNIKLEGSSTDSAGATISLASIIYGESNSRDGETHIINAAQTVSAQENLSLTGGTQANSAARIEITGGVTDGEPTDPNDNFELNLDQSVSTKNQDISIDGGSASDDASGIFLSHNNMILGGGTAVAEAQLSSDSQQHISAGNNLNLSGGDVSGSHATIENFNTPGTSSDMKISAVDISLLGGSNGSQARIQHSDDVTPSSSFDLDASGDVLLRGLDASNRALISSQGTGNTVDVVGSLSFEDTSTPANSDGTRFDVNVGTVAVGSTLNLKGGVIDGTGDITVQQFNWETGSVQGSGDFVTTGTGASASSIDTDGGKVMTGRVWQQQGDVNWTGGDFGLVSTTLNNSGTFTATSDNAITEDGTPVINNSGTFAKTGGAGTTDISPAFINTGNVNAEAGIIRFRKAYVQDSGQTDLNGGDLLGDEGFSFNAGSLVGSGDINGNVNVDAVTLAPGHSPGTINIVGDLIASSATTFDFELGGIGAGEFDRLTVTGDALLAGSMNVSFIDGYNPVLGVVADSFDLIEVDGSITGGFAGENTGPLASNVMAATTQTASVYNVTYTRDELPPAEESQELPDETGSLSTGLTPPPANVRGTPEEVQTIQGQTANALVVLSKQVPERWPGTLPRRALMMCTAGNAIY